MFSLREIIRRDLRARFGANGNRWSISVRGVVVNDVDLRVAAGAQYFAKRSEGKPDRSRRHSAERLVQAAFAMNLPTQPAPNIHRLFFRCVLRPDEQSGRDRRKLLDQFPRLWQVVQET